MRHAGITAAIVFAAALAPLTAALETDELLALIAMPLIVDEVADMTDVPAEQLTAALAAFSGADLRPTRYVEAVQYVPVALTYDARSGDTDFVQYVRDVRNDGLVGDPFYEAVTTHYVDTYGIPRQVIQTEPVFPRERTLNYENRLVSPVVRTVVRDLGAAPTLSRTIISDADWSAPRTTSMELDDLLALMAMPLIANEIAAVTGLPSDSLTAALAAFAGADLRPVRYIETVQYVPVALAYDQRTGETDFVRYITGIRSDGLAGDRFYDAVTTYYVDTYGIPREVIGYEPLFLRDEPRIAYQDRLLSPVVQSVVRDIRSAPSVTRRVVADANWSDHPHGGPPGQLKKRLGLQTGAEVVHGTDRRDTRVVQQRRDERVILDRDDDRGGPPAKATGKQKQDRGPAKAARPDNRGQSKPDNAKPDNRGQQKPSNAKPDDRGKKKAAAAKPDNRGQSKAKGGQGQSGNQGKGSKKKDDGRNRS